MKDRNPKCNCAKNGAMCGRELSLIKQGKLVSDTTVKNKVICSLRLLLNDASLINNRSL
jgi:hypothetical protein